MGGVVAFASAGGKIKRARDRAALLKIVTKVRATALDDADQVLKTSLDEYLEVSRAELANKPVGLWPYDVANKYQLDVRLNYIAMVELAGALRETTPSGTLHDLQSYQVTAVMLKKTVGAFRNSRTSLHECIKDLQSEIELMTKRLQELNAEFVGLDMRCDGLAEQGMPVLEIRTQLSALLPDLQLAKSFQTSNALGSANALCNAIEAKITACRTQLDAVEEMAKTLPARLEVAASPLDAQSENWLAAQRAFKILQSTPEIAAGINGYGSAAARLLELAEAGVGAARSLFNDKLLFSANKTLEIAEAQIAQATAYYRLIIMQNSELLRMTQAVNQYQALVHAMFDALAHGADTEDPRVAQLMIDLTEFDKQKALLLDPAKMTVTDVFWPIIQARELLNKVLFEVRLTDIDKSRVFKVARHTETNFATAALVQLQGYVSDFFVELGDNRASAQAECTRITQCLANATIIEDDVQAVIALNRIVEELFDAMVSCRGNAAYGITWRNDIAGAAITVYYGYDDDSHLLVANRRASGTPVIW